MLFFVVCSYKSKTFRGLSLADGQVIPQGRIKYVQHLEGGIVDEILVKEGDIVESINLLLYYQVKRHPLILKKSIQG